MRIFIYYVNRIFLLVGSWKFAMPSGKGVQLMGTQEVATCYVMVEVHHFTYIYITSVIFDRTWLELLL